MNGQHPHRKLEPLLRRLPLPRVRSVRRRHVARRVGGLVAVLLLWASGSDATCETTANALCLQGARFRVEIDWRTPSASGQGVATALTSDTGYFWFFDDTNVEVVVKVLDGRSLNGHFWVFFGALSDVQYRLTVVDTAAGSSRVYENPQGTLGSVADTAAFPDSSSAGASSAGEDERLSDPTLLAEEGTAGTGAGCGHGDLLCLDEDRFLVTVEWEDAQRHRGSGHATRITRDTGYFWFFDPANVELIVKVLDARVINGSFWVFYGALSDVRYTLRVTDSITGQSAVLTNPLGSLASRAEIGLFPDPPSSSELTAFDAASGQRLASGTFADGRRLDLFGYKDLDQLEAQILSLDDPGGRRHLFWFDADGEPTDVMVFDGAEPVAAIQLQWTPTGPAPLSATGLAHLANAPEGSHGRSASDRARTVLPTALSSSGHVDLAGCFGAPLSTPRPAAVAITSSNPAIPSTLAALVPGADPKQKSYIYSLDLPSDEKVLDACEVSTEQLCGWCAPAAALGVDQVLSACGAAGVFDSICVGSLLAYRSACLGLFGFAAGVDPSCTAPPRSPSCTVAHAAATAAQPGELFVDAVVPATGRYRAALPPAGDAAPPSAQLGKESLQGTACLDGCPCAPGAVGARVSPGFGSPLVEIPGHFELSSHDCSFVPLFDDSPQRISVPPLDSLYRSTVGVAFFSTCDGRFVEAGAARGEQLSTVFSTGEVLLSPWSATVDDHGIFRGTFRQAVSAALPIEGNYGIWTVELDLTTGLETYTFAQDYFVVNAQQPDSKAPGGKCNYSGRFVSGVSGSYQRTPAQYPYTGCSPAAAGTHAGDGPSSATAWRGLP